MAFHPSMESIPENEVIMLSNRVVLTPRPESFSIWKCSHPDCIAYPYAKRAIYCRAVQRPFWALIFVIGILNLLTVTSQYLGYVFRDRTLGISLEERPSKLSDWFTHGVPPVPCHSHNDYWRRVPLSSALRAGCTSVGVDVWPWGNDIIVGHSRHTVLRGTFQSLYLDPLLRILDTHNAPPSRNWPKDMSQDRVGVFSNDPQQTLALIIDFKTDGEQLWPLLVEQLSPLREKGYLTHFNGSNVVYGPITIVAGGDAPFHKILENSTYRDVFYDAPLGNLTFPIEITADDNTLDTSYNPSNSYYASADFRTAIGSLYLSRLSDPQLAILRSQVLAAHELGLKARYWGTPTWPVGLRNHVWSILVKEGVDIIDADDLHGATKQDWKSQHWWNW